MSPPPTREWMEISVHPELCVGTVRRALSKLDDTLKKELQSLKKEGKSPVLAEHGINCMYYHFVLQEIIAHYCQTYI